MKSMILEIMKTRQEQQLKRKQMKQLKTQKKRNK